MIYFVSFFFSIGCVFSLLCIVAWLKGHSFFVYYFIETLYLIFLGEADVTINKTTIEDIDDIIDELVVQLLDSEEDKEKDD